MKKGNKNKKSKMPLIIGLSTGVIVLGGFGYWYFVGRKSSNQGEELPDGEAETSNQTTSNQTGNNQNNYIPNPNSIDPTQEVYNIKKGSKGAIVKEIQQALIKTYGKSILPKFGADGEFGSEMEQAFIKLGRPIAYSQTKAKNLIKELLAESKNENTIPSKEIVDKNMEDKEAIDIAKNLWLYLTTKKFNETIITLKRIKNTEQYKKVNELFKTIRLNGVRQTIVNASLSAFTDGTSKQLIRVEFTRMGLKYDGEKWTLEGFSSRKRKGFYKRRFFKKQPPLRFFRK